MYATEYKAHYDNCISKYFQVFINANHYDILELSKMLFHKKVRRLVSVFIYRILEAKLFHEYSVIVCGAFDF